MDITACLNDLLAGAEADQWEAAAQWFKRGGFRPAWTLPDAPMRIYSPDGRFALVQMTERGPTVFIEHGLHGRLVCTHLERVQ